MKDSPSSLLAQNVQMYGLSGWVSSLTRRRIGSLVLLLALLVISATFILQAKLNYPAVLLDKASLANSLIVQGEGVILLGFVGLLLSGVLLVVISLGLADGLEEKRQRRIVLTGGVAGISWMLSALCGLVLVPLWGNAPSSLVQSLATLILVIAEIITPLGLFLWTLVLIQQFRAHYISGWLSATGLLLMLVRSLFWGLNALLPITSGFYATAGILNILALLGESFWLFWLLLSGFRLSRNEKKNQIRMKRRRFLQMVTNLGVVLAGTAFVGVRTGLTISSSPDEEGDDIPAEASLFATLFFMIMWFYLKFVNPIHTVAQLLRTSSSSTPSPSDVTDEKIDVNGVPAQRILASGAGSSRWILHFHPGGFAQAGTNDNRAFVGRLSKATGASVLYPEYRLIPDHPFPAALNDCVTAYRWLRSQGVAASSIAITGESAGANLVLATVLALRESGEALPGALVAVSPPTDLAMTGDTIKTKALVDPIMAAGLAQDAFALYTNHGATDLRNPLVSPLYANVQGLPPTLLIAGTEEALLSDSTRMAARLKAAGVEVKLEVWPGMWHDFVGSPDSIPEVRLATKHIATFIRQHLKI